MTRQDVLELIRMPDSLIKIAYLEFDPSVPDKRCVQCKRHRYVIYYQNIVKESGLSIIHTYISNPKLLSLEFNEEYYIYIHTWSSSGRAPNCLSSYKEVKI